MVPSTVVFLGQKDVILICIRSKAIQSICVFLSLQASWGVSDQYHMGWCKQNEKLQGVFSVRVAHQRQKVIQGHVSSSLEEGTEKEREGFHTGCVEGKGEKPLSGKRIKHI